MELSSTETHLQAPTPTGSGSSPQLPDIPSPTPHPVSSAPPRLWPTVQTGSSLEPKLPCEPVCWDPREGVQSRGPWRPVVEAGLACARVPEQGLLGVRRLVCGRARGRFPGHLLVDAPGGHPDPQHAGQRGVVQQEARLQEGAAQLRRPRGPCAPQALGLRPPAPCAFLGANSVVTGSDQQEGTWGPQ